VTLGLIRARMAKVPKPLVSGDDSFHAAPAIPGWRERRPHQRRLKNQQKLFRDLEIGLAARVMKRDQDVIRNVAAVALAVRDLPMASALRFTQRILQPVHPLVFALCCAHVSLNSNRPNHPSRQRQSPPERRNEARPFRSARGGSESTQTVTHAIGQAIACMREYR
jgi:hypothetical protein